MHFARQSYFFISLCAIHFLPPASAQNESPFEFCNNNYHLFRIISIAKRIFIQVEHDLAPGRGNVFTYYVNNDSFRFNTQSFTEIFPDFPEADGNNNGAFGVLSGCLAGDLDCQRLDNTAWVFSGRTGYGWPLVNEEQHMMQRVNYEINMGYSVHAATLQRSHMRLITFDWYQDGCDLIHHRLGSNQGRRQRNIHDVMASQVEQLECFNSVFEVNGSIYGWVWGKPYLYHLVIENNYEDIRVTNLTIFDLVCRSVMIPTPAPTIATTEFVEEVDEFGLGIGWHLLIILVSVVVLACFICFFWRRIRRLSKKKRRDRKTKHEKKRTKKPVEKSMEKSKTEKSDGMSKSTEKSAIEKSMEKSETEKSDGKPIEKSAEKSAGSSIGKSTEKSVEKPVEKPIEKSKAKKKSKHKKKLTEESIQKSPEELAQKSSDTMCSLEKLPEKSPFKKKKKTKPKLRLSKSAFGLPKSSSS